MYLTRNQAYRKVPWVRIPPSPPRTGLMSSSTDPQKPRKPRVYGAFLFAVVRCGVSQAGSPGGRFGVAACRHGQRVSYSSQSGDVLDRMWRKQSKIEARSGRHWQRPKGMRLKTYDRLMQLLLACEGRREEALRFLRPGC
jgi:hypothetical protein